MSPPVRRATTSAASAGADTIVAPQRIAASRRKGTVSTPITWGEIDDVHPQDLTIATVPERFARLGDLHAGIDDAVFSLEPLLEWAEPEPPPED